jgi:hypothetical protein
LGFAWGTAFVGTDLARGFGEADGDTDGDADAGALGDGVGVPPGKDVPSPDSVPPGVATSTAEFPPSLFSVPLGEDLLML